MREAANLMDVRNNITVIAVSVWKRTLKKVLREFLFNIAIAVQDMNMRAK